MAKTNFQYEKRQKDLEKKRKKEEKLKKKADKASQPDGGVTDSDEAGDDAGTGTAPAEGVEGTRGAQNGERSVESGTTPQTSSADQGVEGTHAASDSRSADGTMPASSAGLDPT